MIQKLTYDGEAVTYDANGNLLRWPLNGGMADFTYGFCNCLVKVKVADGIGMAAGSAISALSIRTSSNFKGLLSTGDNLARSFRISVIAGNTISNRNKAQRKRYNNKRKRKT